MFRRHLLHSYGQKNSAVRVHLMVILKELASLSNLSLFFIHTLSLILSTQSYFIRKVIFTCLTFHQHVPFHTPSRIGLPSTLGKSSIPTQLWISSLWTLLLLSLRHRILYPFWVDILHPDNLLWQVHLQGLRCSGVILQLPSTMQSALSFVSRNGCNLESQAVCSWKLLEEIRRMHIAHRAILWLLFHLQ